MSRRHFALIERGMTDKTAVCVYPWELPILLLVHGGNVEEKSIDELCAMKEGVIKVEKLKLKHTEHPAPGLREQYEIMAYVAPDEDPALDPAAEYDRLAMRYGMDKDLPIACVTRVYGEFSSGAFTSKLEEHAEDRAPKPTYLKAVDEGMSRAPADMKVGELRKELTARSIKWAVRDDQPTLARKLEDALSPA